MTWYCKIPEKNIIWNPENKNKKPGWILHILYLLTYLISRGVFLDFFSSCPYTGNSPCFIFWYGREEIYTENTWRTDYVNVFLAIFTFKTRKNSTILYLNQKIRRICAGRRCTGWWGRQIRFVFEINKIIHSRISLYNFRLISGEKSIRSQKMKEDRAGWLNL